VAKKIGFEAEIDHEDLSSAASSNAAAAGISAAMNVKNPPNK
jgi:hypothetical protein